MNIPKTFDIPVSGGGGCLEAHQPVYTNKLDLKNLVNGFLDRFYTCTHTGCDLLNTWGRFSKKTLFHDYKKLTFNKNISNIANMVTCQNKAFTLAEVLITLGIIGIIAALTLPALTANYRKHITEVRLEKIYSVMNQAIKLSEADNGEFVLPNKLIENNEAKIEEWYAKNLKKYIKSNKTAAKKLGYFYGINIFFNDGSILVISPGSCIFFPDAKNYKVELWDSETNTDYFISKDSGKTWFTFILTNDKRFEPYTGGWDGTKEKLYTHSSYGCKENTTVERAYCAKLIQINGWKIPKDYFYKF